MAVLLRIIFPFAVLLCIIFSVAVSMAMSSSTKIIVWFRNDLRLHDSSLLHTALKQYKSQQHSGTEFMCVYCFDTRFYSRSSTLTAGISGGLRSSVFRSKFTLESVDCLRNNLRGVGSDLIVAVGKPEDIIPSLLTGSSKSSQVFAQGEVTYEEIAIERRLQRRLHEMNGGAATLTLLTSDKSLYHSEDVQKLFAGLASLPDVFTNFREKVEKNLRVREMLPDINELPAACTDATRAPAAMPALLDLYPDEADKEEVRKELEAINSSSDGGGSVGVMAFWGGEDSARARIKKWMFDDDNLKDYFEIRNGMLGEKYSTKLSPWLANGCLSPRLLYYEGKRYEKERGIANKSTYWIVFELLCRDFFYFVCKRYGSKTFKVGGFKGVNNRSWSDDSDAIERWRSGRTGVPLVDANMRELAQTGWMSNRGRQNVASYLCHELQIDWRLGAEHFERFLLDHDPSSNYGNWNHAAGLHGGRVNRFNMVKQSKDYDANGDYIRYWIPELRGVPAPLLFEPWTMSAQQQQQYGVAMGDSYPLPLAAPRGVAQGYEPRDPAKAFKATAFKGDGSGRRRGGARVQHF